MSSLPRTARYWIATVPSASHWMPYLHDQARYIRGQLEVGEGGYVHWQVVVCFRNPTTQGKAKDQFTESTHVEPTKSKAALAYVWKEQSAVKDTKFELGECPTQRNSPTDWALVREAATGGRMGEVPDDIYVRCFHQLRSIQTAHLRAVAVERQVTVFWGPTATGKSRRAWQLAGIDAYPKDPRSKFWDGYQAHECVVIDEFRGAIDISHLLRWFDRYPVLVEVKGSSACLVATRIYVTSNLHPSAWFPELDELSLSALLRRLEIVHFAIPVSFEGGNG